MRAVSSTSPSPSSTQWRLPEAAPAREHVPRRGERVQGVRPREWPFSITPAEAERSGHSRKEVEQENHATPAGRDARPFSLGRSPLWAGFLQLIDGELPTDLEGLVTARLCQLYY